MLLDLRFRDCSPERAWGRVNVPYHWGLIIGSRREWFDETPIVEPCFIDFSWIDIDVMTVMMRVWTCPSFCGIWLLGKWASNLRYFRVFQQATLTKQRRQFRKLRDKTEKLVIRKLMSSSRRQQLLWGSAHQRRGERGSSIPQCIVNLLLQIFTNAPFNPRARFARLSLIWLSMNSGPLRYPDCEAPAYCWSWRRMIIFCYTKLSRNPSTNSKTPFRFSLSVQLARPRPFSLVSHVKGSGLLVGPAVSAVS